MNPLSLKRNFIWAFGGNAVYAACQWSMLMVLAKLNQPEMVGTYALAIAIATPITLFSNLQLASVFVTDAQREYSFRDYLCLRYLTAIFSVFIIIGIAYFSENGAKSAYVIIIVGFGQGLLSIREIYLAAMQKQERMDIVSHSNTFQGLLSLVLFTVIIYVTRNLIWGVFALLIARGIVLFFYDRPKVQNFIEYQRERIQNHTSFSTFHRLAKLGWLSVPLGVTAAIISLNTNAPRYFLEHFHNKMILGYFAAIASLLAAEQMIIAALGQSAMPRLSKYYVSNRKAFCILMIKLVGVGFVLGICGLMIAIIWGRDILTILFKPDYAKYHKELNWIMIAGAINACYSFMGYSIAAARYFKMTIILSAGTLATAVLSGWFLVPEYDVLGAAWSMVFASLTGLISAILIIIYVIYHQNMEGDILAGNLTANP